MTINRVYGSEGQPVPTVQYDPESNVSNEQVPTADYDPESTVIQDNSVIYIMPAQQIRRQPTKKILISVCIIMCICVTILVMWSAVDTSR